MQDTGVFLGLEALIYPSPRHPGSSRLLCLRGGSHVISQVLHRGLGVQSPAFSSFSHSFPQFLLPLPLPLLHQFPQDLSSLLKVPVLPLGPPVLSSGAILGSWLTDKDRNAPPPLGHQRERQSFWDTLPSQPPTIPPHQAPDKGSSLEAFGGRRQML